MKRRLSRMALVLLVTGGVLAGAGQLHAGAGYRIGASYSSMSGTEQYPDAIVLPTGGFVGVFGVSNVLSAQAEFLFVMKGGSRTITRSRAPGSDTETRYVHQESGYLEIPLLLRADAGRTWTVHPFLYTGVAPAVLVYDGSPWQPERFEVGWVVGGGAGFGWGRLRLEGDLRYTHGLTSMEIGWLQPELAENRAWALSVAFIFAPGESQ